MRPPRRHLVPVAGIALVAVLCLRAESVARLGTGLPFVAPALLPLLAGRYLGEDTLVRFRARRAAARPRRVAAAVPAFRRRPLAAVRGGRLLAGSLAERGPPAALHPAV